MKNAKDAIILILAGCVVTQSNLPPWLKLAFGAGTLTYATWTLWDKVKQN